MAPTPHTISKAVSLASSGDTIIVGPGTYNESVTINAAITLLGAQAGNDARVNRHDPAKESTVDATGKGSSAFYVHEESVVIDGFTVEGAHSYGSPTPYPAGIYVGSYKYVQVLNNILQNSSTGVYLYGAGQNVIEHNLFRNNNEPGAPNPGCGIVSNGGGYFSITENEFTGNKGAAIDVNGSSGGMITNNTSENDGAFVIFAGTTVVQFSHNRGKDFGHTGVLPVGFNSSSIYADAAVDLGPGNIALVISDNDLEKGEAPISNGIAFTTVFGTSCGYPPCTNNTAMNVRNNMIKRFPDYGIVVGEQSGTGMLGEFSFQKGVYPSWIVGNEVYDNGWVGIFIEAASSYNSGISLFDNEAEGNRVDCEDDTKYGTGTPLPTGNTWFNNTGNSSSPTGLCTPGRGHDHDWR
jgi:parallel beta-helix repeat protein